MTHVHVLVKFSPRWDTPALTRYQNLKVSVEMNSWKVEALGLKGSTPIRYKLDLNRLYMALIPFASTWSYDA